MAISAKKYQQLLDEVDELKSEKAKAEGVVEQLFQELEAEFDCKTLKKAKVLLKEIKEENDELEEKFNAKFKTFEAQLRDGVGSSVT